MLNISNVKVTPTNISDDTEVILTYKGYIIHVSDNPVKMELTVQDYPDVYIVEDGKEKQSCNWDETFVVYPGASYSKTITLRIKHKPDTQQAYDLKLSVIDATGYDVLLNTQIAYK